MSVVQTGCLGRLRWLPWSFRSGAALERSRSVQKRRRRSARKKALRDARRWAEEARLAAEVFGGDLTVRGGPFRGMQYVERACGSHLLPKLAGTYEEPIHEWVLQARGQYDRLVNIGCAEGYYAVGFAWAGLVPQVFAFDIDAQAIQVARTLAQKNGQSDRVTFGSRCDHEQLEQLISDRTLVLCDIEGAELELLDPERCPALVRADVIFEAHDCFVPGLSQTLIRRFLPTHRIQVVYDSPRDLSRCDCLAGLPRPLALRVVDEKRPEGMSWVRMLSLARASGR